MDEKTETVKMTEAESLRVMLSASQLREAESQMQTAEAAVQLRKTEQQMLANSIATKYTENGKYRIIGMDLEKGIQRVLTSHAPVPAAENGLGEERPHGPRNPPSPPNPPEAG